MKSGNAVSAFGSSLDKYLSLLPDGHRARAEYAQILSGGRTRNYVEMKSEAKVRCLQCGQDWPNGKAVISGGK